MEYAIGALVGAAFGSAVCFLKYFLVWKAFLKPDENGNVKDSKIYMVMVFNNFVNVGTLLVVFLLRNVLPFNFAATIIATALALSLVNRFCNVNKVVEKLNKFN